MRVRGLLALLAVGSVLGLVASQALGAAAATTWTVDKTTGTNNCAANICKTIAKAVQKASDGDTIVVHKGQFNENVVIDKQLTLTGAARPTLVNSCNQTTAADPAKDTIVNAGAGDYAFDIEADNVSFNGFVFTNPTPGKWGVVVDLLTQDASYSGFTFKKNSFEHMAAGTTALFLSSNGTNPTLVDSNCFRLNGEDAIFAGWGPTDTLKSVTVSGNRFVKNAYGDVIFANPDQQDIQISGNIATGDGLFALLINTSGFSISGNISKSNATAPTAEHAVLYLGGNNSDGQISGNVFQSGTERGIVFDQTYTGVPNTNLTVSGNIVQSFPGNGIEAPVAQSLKSSTINNNIVKVTGTYGLQLVGGNNTNSFLGNIITGKTWGCHAMGNSVGGNNWNGNSNIGKPKNTPSTCFP